MRRLVVALDYGTSNSGAAYTVVDDEDDDRRADVTDDIDVVRDWPRACASRDASEKVPSDITYGRDGQAIGHGFEATGHDAAPLQWVKLLLEPVSFSEQSNRTSRVWHSYYALDSKALRKRPVDVIGDYLRWLWKRVKAAILEREGEDEDTELFEAAHLTVVLTVPASWSAPAKQRMAMAAVLAGIPEQCIKTLAEPEAAAVCGLKKKARQRAVGNEDCVIIVDAGGGTVDAVAYQVRTRDPLSLKQITVSKGDFCGSSFVNNEFRNQLQSILDDRYSYMSEKGKDRIDEEFEFNIKRTYNPFQERAAESSYYLPVDGLDDDKDLGIHDGRMKVDEAIISEAFDSVMTQIMTLIDDQRAEVRLLGLESKIKGVLLVGGFGRSPFLRARLRQEFSNRNDPKIWPADDSWTAVVRGAVACEASALGRQALIHSRLSGYNYGVPYLDCGRRKVRWLVRKGESVQNNMCTEPYALRIDDQPWLDHDENCLVMVPIVVSSDEHPSNDYTDSVTPHAEIKCRLATSLRFSPGAKEIQVVPTKAWHIPATLVLYFDGALISFRCKIGDDKVGVAEVTYFKDEADCITEEALASESETSLPIDKVGGEKHLRVDSTLSHLSASASCSEEHIASAEKPKLRQKSAPAALHLDTESGAPLTPLSASASPSASFSAASGSSAKDPAKSKKKRFLGIRTQRDTADKPQKPRNKFLAPAPNLTDLTMEERLNMVYRKGWTPRPH